MGRYRNARWEGAYKHKVNPGELEFYTVETVPIMYRPRSKEAYFDRECLKLNTAIRAVWILYRRGRWELLESIMLPRWKYEKPFLDYDNKHIFTEHGLIRTDRQTMHFAESIPGVIIAASILIEEYRDLYIERLNEQNEIVS